MKVTIRKSPVKDEKVLAVASVEFDDAPGCVLDDFMIRRGERNPWVSAPSRSYMKDGVKKYVPLFHSVGDNKKPWYDMEHEIIRAYNTWRGKLAEGSDESVFDQGADEFGEAPF